jgi:hypothetical protein
LQQNFKMRYTFLVVLISFFNISYGQSKLINSTSTVPIGNIDTCLKLVNQGNLRKLKDIKHSIPIIIANDIIVNINEIKAKLIDTMSIIRCPQSFEKWGNLGTLGIIQIGTKQKFKTIKVTKILEENHVDAKNPNVFYALNGYLFTDKNLSISKNAIVKIDIIKNPFFEDSTTNKNATCINIWTITEKEKKENESLPKLCRGVGVGL